MAGLFGIILIVAIVGLIRPFFGWGRGAFAGIALVSLIGIGATAPKNAPTQADPPAVAKAEPEPTSAASRAADSTPAAEPAASSNWSYSESKDAMRGTASRFAVVKSENEVDLDFPYGTVHGKITVRRRPQDGLNIMFSVDEGQVLCHSFSDSYVSAKFDDGPVERFSCSGASDGSSETAFIEGESRFLAKLRKAKRTVIEAEFYQKGPQQFIFETAGLEWK